MKKKKEKKLHQSSVIAQYNEFKDAEKYVPYVPDYTYHRIKSNVLSHEQDEHRRSLKRPIIICVIIVLLIGAFATSVALIPEWKGMITRTSLSALSISSSAGEQDVSSLQVGYIPQGFSCSKTETTASVFKEHFENSGGDEWFEVEKYPATTKLSYDLESRQIVLKKDNLLVLKNSNDVYQVVENRGGYIYVISGINGNQIDLGVLCKIADAVE